ncbi:MAG: hypothetical protein WCD44_03595 [Candidatus Babeliales bacterium]
MSKGVVIVLLFITKANYCVENNFSYAEKPTINHQIITAEKGNFSAIINNVLSKIAPVIPSIIVFGKMIAHKIKEKKESKQHEMAYEELEKMKKRLQQQRKQLQDLTTLYAHYCCQEFSPIYKKKLKQRSSAIKKLLQGKMGLSTYTDQWSYCNTLFMQQFNLLSVPESINRGVKLQQVLANEFCTMGKETENLWSVCYQDQYLQHLIERSVTCIKEGMKCNKIGNVTQATLFADIGWAILAHIHAMGEGVCLGAAKTVYAFLHPIKLANNNNNGMNQFVYSLGQMTLDVIDFYMLAIKNPVTAQKKLYVWRKSFVALLNKIQQDWQVETSHDVTKFISEFAVERVATYGIYQMLGKIFLVAQVNAKKLAQKKEFFTHTQQFQVPEGVGRVAESMQDMLFSCIDINLGDEQGNYFVKRKVSLFF